MGWLKDNQLAFGVGVAASVVATFLTNEAMPAIIAMLGYAKDAQPHIGVRGLIYLAAFTLPPLAIFTLFKAVPLVVRALALLSIMFLAHGFRSWASRNAGPNQAKDLWSWIADQMLVAQGRHAFSVECIAFSVDEAKGQTRVALLHRSFSGFTRAVYLWPGGRIRGVEDDLGDEARRIFKRETGCTVRLVSSTLHDGERLLSVDGQGREIVNAYSPAPFLVMHQNRAQKFGVPGHVALLYVGTLEDASGKFEEVRLVDVDRIRRGDDFQPLELWQDTAKSILLAHDYWRERNQKVSAENRVNGARASVNAT